MFKSPRVVMLITERHTCHSILPMTYVDGLLKFRLRIQLIRKAVRIFGLTPFFTQ